MAGFPEFTSDVQFTEAMVTEQSVFCLPATVSARLIVALSLQTSQNKLNTKNIIHHPADGDTFSYR